jgi:mannose-6-phosphate isomerase-like protein (cupin superfamily)
MIIRSAQLPSADGRTSYPIADQQAILHHLSVRDTTPQNPFGPHKHERAEIWYIIEGEALVSVDGCEDKIGPGDVILLDPWTLHGLRTESRARWICLG